MKFEVQLNGPRGAKSHAVEFERNGDSWRVQLDGQPIEADAVKVSSNTISLLLDGQSYEIHIASAPGGNLKVQIAAEEFTAEVQDPRAWGGRKHGLQQAEGRQQIVAPMPGKVIRLLVAVGDSVEAGQGLLVVEAMKMQNEIRSPKSGKVGRLLATEGQAVNAGDVLAWVE